MEKRNGKDGKIKKDAGDADSQVTTGEIAQLIHGTSHLGRKGGEGGGGLFQVQLQAQ